MSLPSPYEITTDQLVTFSWYPSQIDAYSNKNYAFNFSTVLITYAVAAACFMNVATALVYGGIGLAIRWTIQSELQEIEGEGSPSNRASNAFNKLNLNEDKNWIPDWVVFCGHIILRHGLPSGITSKGGSKLPN